MIFIYILFDSLFLGQIPEQNLIEKKNYSLDLIYFTFLQKQMLSVQNNTITNSRLNRESCFNNATIPENRGKHYKQDNQF